MSLLQLKRKREKKKKRKEEREKRENRGKKKKREKKEDIKVMNYFLFSIATKHAPQTGCVGHMRYN